MNRNTIRSSVALLLMSALLFSFGCINDPKEAPLPPPAESKYGDLTEKEHTIGNLVLSYTHRDIEHYSELLHQDYIWYLQAGDYEPSEDNYFLRQKDINMTRNMFLAANGQYAPIIDKLALVIDPGNWYPVSKIGERDCEDGEFWQTERGYRITVGIGEMTYIGDDIIIVNIAKDPVTQKYSIMSIYDVDK